MLPLHLRDLPKLLVGSPLDALVGGLGASVQLQYAVQHSVIVHRPPRAGKGLVVAKVVAAAYLPALGRVKGLDDVRPPALFQQRFDLHALLRGLCRVGCVAEFLEKLPLEDVPAPVQPRLPQFGRQRLQLLDVVGLLGHEHLVVRHQRLNKRVVIGVFALLEFAVDEYPLDVGMPLAAGIHGVINPLGKAVRASQTRADGLHLVLGQLRGLVEVDHVVFHALEPVHVAVLGAVGKVDGRSVAEFEHLVLVVVPGDPLQLGPQSVDVVVDQLRIRPAHDQLPDARVVQRQQLGLGPHRPALSTASRPAEADILGVRAQKLLLLGGRLYNTQNHLA